MTTGGDVGVSLQQIDVLRHVEEVPSELDVGLPCSVRGRSRSQSQHFKYLRDIVDNSWQLGVEVGQSL